MEWFVDAVVFAGGYAACWYTKDWLAKAYMGTETFIQSLEAKAAALKTAITPTAK